MHVSSLPQRDGYLPVFFPPLVVSSALGRHHLLLRTHLLHPFLLPCRELGQDRNLQYQAPLLGDILLQVSRDD